MINKFTDFLNEYVSNLSKNRKWPSRNTGKLDYSDLYFTYSLPKSELGKYLNTWFVGVIYKSKDGKQTYRDEMVTLKKTDKETSNHLYHREYNPITITILAPTGASVNWKRNEKGEDCYRMKAQIHSVDDSSYGIWWNEWDEESRTLDSLVEIRTQLMKWINACPIINGEEFFDVCIGLGADEESKDYN
jgi:hypothetical protein